MPFDRKAFLKAPFRHREEEVPVPDMAAFFPDGERAVWKVRGMTGQEKGWADEQVDAKIRDKVFAFVRALLGGSAKEIEEAAQYIPAGKKGTAESVSKSILYLTIGSVDPPCDHELAVNICTRYPIEFQVLVLKILELTGKGQDPGKLKPSGGTDESAAVLPSVPPEGDSSTK